MVAINDVNFKTVGTFSTPTHPVTGHLFGRGLIAECIQTEIIQAIAKRPKVVHLFVYAGIDIFH